MITINRSQETSLCELGGGSKPVVHPRCLGGKDIHIDARMCLNAEGKQCVDIVHNLSKFPWPLEDNKFDGIVAVFILEHVPYTQTNSFLGECFRICKSGSKVVFVIPNTLEQIRWITNNPNGWDNKPFFEAASENLFGSQDDLVKEQEVFVGSYHCAFFSPVIATQLFEKVGFENIMISPFGERATDMVVQANKPSLGQMLNKSNETSKKTVDDLNTVVVRKSEDLQSKQIEEQPQLQDTPTIQEYNGPNKVDLTTEQRAKLFDRRYYDAYPGSRLGFFWDEPRHEITARKVLERKPESVVELGCGRGYILKRVEDAGVKCKGMDISKHCDLTRVSNGVSKWNVCETPWIGYPPPYPLDDKKTDLCFSISFLEHIPEELLPKLIQEMERTCLRGLHGITFQGQEQYPDSTRCTLRSKEWWIDKLPKTHEVLSVQELEQGGLPDDYVNGDGRIKLSVGTAWTMVHNGWQNIDMIDAVGFANQYRYNFKQLDVRKGLPYSTGVVDLVFASHFLEHLTYAEGLSFLRECRRVIRPDGGMRLIVPDAQLLMKMYSEYRDLNEFSEVNTNCADATTSVGKLWALLHEGHKACYDGETLCKMLAEARWDSVISSLRGNESNSSSIGQILRESVEMGYGYSLFVNAFPSK